jgi:hypothetical protein
VHKSLVQPCAVRLCVALPSAGGSEGSALWGVDNNSSTFLLPELRVGLSSISTPARDEAVSPLLQAASAPLGSQSPSEAASMPLAEQLENIAGPAVVSSTLEQFTSPVRPGAPLRLKSLVDGATLTPLSSPMSHTSKGEPLNEADAALATPSLSAQASPAATDATTPLKPVSDMKAAGVDEARLESLEFPPCPEACRSELWSSFVLAGRCAYQLRDTVLAQAFAAHNASMSILSPAPSPAAGVASLGPPQGQ